jgi:NAD(P) transhydrogenase
MRYDILILGGGVAAQQAALEAARLGRRVALIARPAPLANLDPEQPVLDVLSPADALARLAEQRREQGLVGAPSSEELRAGLEQIIREESEIVRQHLEWSGVNVLCGEPRLINSHAVEIESPGNYWVLGIERLLVANGTAARRPAYLPFDGQRILTTDDLLNLAEIPGDVVIVGAGRTGLTAATALARLGSRVTMIDGRTLNSTAASDGAADLLNRAEEAGVILRTGVEAIGVDRLDANRLAVRLADGGALECGQVLWSVERVGRTGGLNLQVAGIEPDESGRLWCNDLSQTWAPHICAVGEVVGFGPLRSDSAAAGAALIRQIFGDEKLDDRPLPAEIERAELIGV